jgi:hypothetical protein
MDVKVIAALIGVSGIVVAACLSAFGYFWKTMLEAKRSYRKSLYLLLEIQHSIYSTLFDPKAATDEYYEHYANRLKAKGVEINKGQIEGELYNLVLNHFKSLVETQKTDIQQRLLEPFEQSLMELATVNPVLAYRLRGRENIAKIVSITKDYFDKIDKEISKKVDRADEKAFLNGHFKRLISEVLVKVKNSIDEDVKLLAKSCGRRDYAEVKRNSESKFVKIKNYDFSELDDYIDSFLAEAEKQVHKQN